METLVITSSVSPNASAGEQRLRMTYEEYLAWAGEDTRGEWVNGETIKFMPPKALHQNILIFLASVLQLFVKHFKLGYVGVAPLEVRVTKDSAREPDIIFVSSARLSIVNDDRVDGAPDLVIEIVSKDSVQRDREEKYDEYETAGVHEYWIIDNRPRRPLAEFYRLDANGAYQRVEITDGVFRSEVLPGFWLRVDWLWQKEPDEWDAIDEIIGLDNIAKARRRK